MNQTTHTNKLNAASTPPNPRRKSGARPAIPGRYRTPLPRTLLVIAIMVVAACMTLMYGTYNISPANVLNVLFQGGVSDIDRYFILD